MDKDKRGSHKATMMEQVDVFDDLRTSGPASVDHRLIEQLKEQLRQEVEQSVRESLMASMQQARGAEVRSESDNHHQLNGERSELDATAFQSSGKTSNIDRSADDLRSMKAAFIQSMAMKQMSRDSQEADDICTIAEEDESGSQSRPSMESRVSCEPMYDFDSMERELLERSFVQRDLDAINNLIDQNVLVVDVKSAALLRNIKQIAVALDLDSIEAKNTNKSWISMKQKIANLRAEVEMTLQTASRKPVLRLESMLEKETAALALEEEATLYTQNTLVDRPLIDKNPVEEEPEIDEMDKKFEEVEKKGRLLRFLQKSKKKIGSGKYLFLRQNVPRRKPSKKASVTQIDEFDTEDDDLVVLSPNKQKTTSAPPVVPRYATTNRALLKVAAKTDVKVNNGCVLVCFSPTVAAQAPIIIPEPEMTENQILGYSDDTQPCQVLAAVTGVGSDQEKHSKATEATEQSFELSRPSSSASTWDVQFKEIEVGFQDPFLTSMITASEEECM